MKRTLLCFALLVATTIAVACAAGGGNALVGTRWVLTSMRGEAPLKDTEITLIFEEKQLGGCAGCNDYGGGPDSGRYVATKSGKLDIPMLAITVELCLSPEGVMEQEATYVEALRSAASYRIVDDTLEIRNPDGEMVLVYARKP